MNALQQASAVAPSTGRAVRSSSFYVAMRILPRSQRRAMYEVYAFCRAVDNIADDPGPRSDRMAALARWREDICRMYAGLGVTDLTRGLANPVESYGLRSEDFLAVVSGMEMDVAEDMRAPDWETLDLYCDRVASAVGRLSVRIFGIDNTNGLELAHHLGRALQMTNILRDLDEDAAMGRLYLPKEALSAAGIASRDIAEVLSHPRLGEACMLVAERARRHFAQAEAASLRGRRAAMRSPRLMASVYKSVLDRLVERGWTAPRASVRSTRSQILWRILRHGLF